MNKIFNSLLITGILVSVACGGGSKGTLDEKKKQLATLKSEVSKLEKEIAALDTTAIKEDKTKLVETTEISLQSFKHFIDIQGRVDADENVSVSPKMPGTVTQIYVKTGDAVKAGQTLAQLDDQQVRKGIEELKNRMELAKTVYEKQKNLWEQKIGTEIAFLQAKNNKDAMDKSLASMNEQLEMFKIKSLTSGIVDEVGLKLGQMANPGFSTIRIVNDSKLKVKADVAETYASKVKAGNNVILSFPDINNEVPATVSYVSKVINNVTRTFNVESFIPVQNENYRPNMVAVLKIIDYEKSNSVIVPINAVQNSEDGQYVFVAETENGKIIARKKVISAGMNYNGKIEILNGLKPTEKLITTGYQDLNDGQIIKVAN